MSWEMSIAIKVNFKKIITMISSENAEKFTEKGKFPSVFGERV